MNHLESGKARDLCLSLLRADTEQEVIDLLKKYGDRDDPTVWRYYGDKEDNFATIGNQQSAPDAALVEKIVNSVDAVLMGECWSQGMSPDDPNAPRSIAEAVALYFWKDRSKTDTFGHISYWGLEKRRELSTRITLAATGTVQNPCFTISDSGEGQTPESMPKTLLSLDQKNKINVHFVQGKFNMGGTGALQFCGHHNLQLVVSRRKPGIPSRLPTDGSLDDWGFVVVRREDPTGSRRVSTYTYLAPVNADNSRRQGGVLRFKSKTMPLFPRGNAPYAREAEWGTAIKLYGYEAAGFKSHILRGDGLLQRLDILLPEVALPLRLHECRANYGGHAGSFDTLLTGLSVRLGDDRAGNLEEGFPTTSPFSVSGQQMTAKIHAFRRGKADTYRKTEGLIFVVNGQTHGHLTRSFFSRKSVGMNRLEESILVIVDCSRVSGRAREDLFMNSRDRLRSGEFRGAIEQELESIIKNHQGLRDLRERRRREDVESKLQDAKPMKEVLESILRKSPSLAALFAGYGPLPNPFKAKLVQAADKPPKLRKHPTYFKFRKLDYGRELLRETSINMRSRIVFETDVVNDYFDRQQDPGTFTLVILAPENLKGPCGDYNLNLENGIATLNVKVPQDSSVEDVTQYEATVADATLIQPFTNKFTIRLKPAQESAGGKPTKAKPGRGDEAGDKREGNYPLTSSIFCGSLYLDQKGTTTMIKYTIKTFDAQFPTDDACLDWLKQNRWPNGITCSKCQRVTKHYRVTGRPAYACEFCGKMVSPMAGTIMEKSTTPLRSWFHAMFLMASTRCGISAKQLERELGVTYKTAWRMFKQIRSMLTEDVVLGGSSVEVDETYVGGKDINRHESKRSHARGRGAGGKTVVFGMAQRKGKVIAKVVPDVKASTLLPVLKEKVLERSIVYTDELNTYDSLNRMGYDHRRIHHASKVYVMGDIHTNTIEGFWSLVKRGIGGVNHAVSEKYLQTYLNEYAFRYNRRDQEQPMFEAFLAQVVR